MEVTAQPRRLFHGGPLSTGAASPFGRAAVVTAASGVGIGSRVPGAQSRVFSATPAIRHRWRSDSLHRLLEVHLPSESAQISSVRRGTAVAVQLALWLLTLSAARTPALAGTRTTMCVCVWVCVCVCACMLSQYCTSALACACKRARVRVRVRLCVSVHVGGTPPPRLPLL